MFTLGSAKLLMPRPTVRGIPRLVIRCPMAPDPNARTSPKMVKMILKHIHIGLLEQRLCEVNFAELFQRRSDRRLTMVLTATCLITAYSLQMSKTRYNPCNAPSKPQILDWIIYPLS
jgi:hypothetical protein